jgi:hypothetical protein
LECGDLSPLSERPKEVASRFSGEVRRNPTLAKTPESGDKSPHSKEIFACFAAGARRLETPALRVWSGFRHMADAARSSLCATACKQWRTAAQAPGLDRRRFP